MNSQRPSSRFLQKQRRPGCARGTPRRKSPSGGVGAQPLRELKPIWRFFGADEPNYACMKDGAKPLGEPGAWPAVFFRTHNLLTTGDGRRR
jgi:hypothetical protein